MRAEGGSRWEKKLRIRTEAENYEKDDANHSRYEPTDYRVLERLAESGYIGRDNVLVDYGCGKGRVGFFINYAVGCRTVGVEYNGELVRDAEENLKKYAPKGAENGGVSFVCINAEEYRPDEADCFYFFNPFSEKILSSVLGRIIESYYGNPRPMKLFFYYALDSYLTRLMAADELRFEGEIDCRDLFHNEDFREKILVFSVE